MNRFDATFKKYHQNLLLYATKFLRSESDALDAVQEVFTLVWEKQKYKLDDDHLKTFLFSAVRNRCLNLLKHQKVVQKHRSFETGSIERLELYYYKSGEKSLIEKENLNKIYSAINSLTEIYKEILILSRFEGLKNEEIAERLDIPVRTVETRLYRSLVQLRKKISKELFIFFLKFNTL